jgi:hypothetical protein
MESELPLSERLKELDILDFLRIDGSTRNFSEIVIRRCMEQAWFLT